MKKFLSILLVVLMATTTVSAKKYRHSLGLNAGLQLGVSYKINVNNHFTIFEEFIPYGGVISNGSYSWLGNWANFAYEAEAVKGQNIIFSWYVGGGTKIGYAYAPGGVWGINAMAGFEINMANAPIAVTFDFRPGYALAFYSFGGGGGGGTGWDDDDWDDDWDFKPGIKKAGIGGGMALTHIFDYAFCLGVRYTF